MTLTHTGSTKKYSAGWENIFGGRKKPVNGAKPKSKQKATVKKKRKG